MAKELLHRFPSGPKPTTFHEEAVQRHSADCAAISTTFLKKFLNHGLLRGFDGEWVGSCDSYYTSWIRLASGPIYFA